VLVSCFGLSTSFLAALRAISSMRKRSQDQGSTSSKRSTPTRPATEQTSEIPARVCFTSMRPATNAGATMHDLRKTSILRCSDSVVEPDAATEHMTINSLDDVVSKLAFECDESAAVLRNAVQTLQGGVQAEVRNLCSRWNVQLTTKDDNGKYRKRADHILKSELENTFIAKAKEHFRAKATENQPIQLKKETDAPTSSSATERAASVATEHAKVEFSIEDAIAETLHRIKSIDADIEILVRIVDHACHSQQCVSHRVATMCREAKWKIATDLFSDQPLDACGINHP